MKPTLYLDIETIAAPESYKDGIEVKAPGQYKKQDSIDKWIAENGDAARDEIHRKTSFNGGYGQVCAIAWAIDDGPIEATYITDHRAHEKTALQTFVKMVTDRLPFSDVPEICGHYISGFDLRFLKQRGIIHGIKMPYWLAKDYKPWELRDTMTMWAGNRDTIGLDELCRILGIEGKGDMDGSQVYDAWLAGEHEKIADYCRDDVARVRFVDQKFKEAGL